MNQETLDRLEKTDNSVSLAEPKMSASIVNLTKALTRVQAIISPALKDSTNPFFKSKYADLQSVWESLRKPLTDNGFAVVQLAGGNGDVVSITTILTHSSGEWISGVIAMKPAKNDPQGAGSCISYARRYALSAIVGSYAADDDGNAASTPAVSRPTTGPIKVS